LFSSLLGRGGIDIALRKHYNLIKAVQSSEKRKAKGEKKKWKKSAEISSFTINSGELPPALLRLFRALHAPRFPVFPLPQTDVVCFDFLSARHNTAKRADDFSES
jgi:hypothetical protein